MSHELVEELITKRDVQTTETKQSKAEHKASSTDFCELEADEKSPNGG